LKKALTLNSCQTDLLIFFIESPAKSVENLPLST
jgi:hypothetical protein